MSSPWHADIMDPKVGPSTMMRSMAALGTTEVSWFFDEHRIATRYPCLDLRAENMHASSAALCLLVCDHVASGLVMCLGSNLPDHGLVTGTHSLL